MDLTVVPNGLQIKGSQKDGKQLTGNPIKQAHRKSMTLRFTQSQETKQKGRAQDTCAQAHMHQPPSETKNKRTIKSVTRIPTPKSPRK